jgi:hypothetical protein
LCALLEDAGFDVYFPEGIDGDDACARLAMKLNCPVLSRDNDMMRYGLKQGSVLCDFAIREGRISFLARDYQRAGIAPRDVSSIPCDDLTDWVAKGSKLLTNASTGKLRRGNADRHTRTLGNLHAIARPLRAALYARHGIGEVIESLPAWRDGGFVLEVTEVGPDATLDHLLDDASAAFDWIRRADKDGLAEVAYEDRTHAAAMIAAELCDAALPPDDRRTAGRIAAIYTGLHLTDAVPAKHEPDWHAGGMCYGLRGSHGCIGDKWLFPMHIEQARYRGKDPLCQPCLQRLFEQIEEKKSRASNPRSSGGHSK